MGKCAFVSEPSKSGKKRGVSVHGNQTIAGGSYLVYKVSWGGRAKTEIQRYIFC